MVSSQKAAWILVCRLSRDFTSTSQMDGRFGDAGLYCFGT